MCEEGYCAFNIQPRLAVSQKNGILSNSNYHISKSWININEEILEIMVVLR